MSLEAKLDRVADGLEALTAAILRATDTKLEEVKSDKPVSEKTKAKEDKKKTTTDKSTSESKSKETTSSDTKSKKVDEKGDGNDGDVVTIEDIRDALITMEKKKAKKLLQTFDAKKLSDLEKDQYSDFLKEAKKIATKEAEAAEQEAG